MKTLIQGLPCAAALALLVVFGDAEAEDAGLLGSFGVNVTAEKTLGCHTLVIADVEHENQQPKAGGDFRPIAFDPDACRQLVRPFSWLELEHGLLNKGAVAPIWKASDANDFDEVRRLVQAAKPRQSEYWRMVQPLAAFCESLGLPPAGYIRYCNFGAFGSGASPEARVLLKTSVMRESACCESDPIKRTSSSGSFAELFAPGQETLPFSTFESSLTRDGFSCADDTDGRTCAKSYLQVQSGHSPAASYLLAPELKLEAAPHSGTFIAIGRMSVTKVVRLPPPDSPMVFRRLGNQLGIHLGSLPASPTDGTPLMALFVALNDIVPPNN